MVCLVGATSLVSRTAGKIREKLPRTGIVLGVIVNVTMLALSIGFMIGGKQI